MMVPVGLFKQKSECVSIRSCPRTPATNLKPRAVRAQAFAVVACGGACASVFWFDSSLGRNYFSPHGFQLGRPDEARTYGHGGGAPGMNGILRGDPESGQSVIVLCNLDNPVASRLGDWLHARMPLK